MDFLELLKAIAPIVSLAGFAAFLKTLHDVRRDNRKDATEVNTAELQFQQSLLQTARDSITTTLESMRKELDSVRGRLELVEGENTALRHRVRTLEEENEQLRNQLKELNHETR